MLHLGEVGLADDLVEVAVHELRDLRLERLRLVELGERLQHEAVPSRDGRLEEVEAEPLEVCSVRVFVWLIILAFLL